jgi:enoyl-CoA hydratase/carnithine racemase
MVARVVPHDDLLDEAREVLGQCCRTAPAARSMVKSSLDNYMAVRPHRHAGQLLLTRSDGRLPRVQGAPIP